MFLKSNSKTDTGTFQCTSLLITGNLVSQELLPNIVGPACLPICLSVSQKYHCINYAHIYRSCHEIYKISSRERNNLGQWLLSELKWGGLRCELAEFTQNAAALLGLWRRDLALRCYYNPSDPGSEEESLGFASHPAWHVQFWQDNLIAEVEC